MKVLIIGNSRIVRRRVLPALRSVPTINVVAIASRTTQPGDVEPGVTFFSDYETAIARSGADLAYVSMVNSEHARWTRRCLEAGLHVVVDKPSCLRPEDARQVVDLAEAKRCCVAEATVFSFHPQFAALGRTFEDAGNRPTRVTAIFSFPPFEPGDFRNRRELGGGAFYDLGPYVAATSRIVFGRAPRAIACEVVSRNHDGLDTGFSTLLTYDDGGAFIGHFGFNTEYQNRLFALGSGLAVEIHRAFTLPPDVPGRVLMRRNNVESETEITPADAFAIFFQAVVNAIEQGKWDHFATALVADADLIADLRRAAGEH